MTTDDYTCGLGDLALWTIIFVALIAGTVSALVAWHWRDR